jgi:glucose-1-phosphatase
MSIRAVIWDLGGVMLRTEDVGPRQAMAERLGMSRLELEEIVFGKEAGKRAQCGEIGVTEHWTAVVAPFGMTIQAFQAEFFGGDRLDYALVEAIRGLKPRYRTGLLSNAFLDLRGLMTEQWKIADAFDAMVISAEAGMMKPDERIYRLALEQLGVAPEEAIFVDDFRRNVEGARQVGLQAIHFREIQQAWSELEQILQEAER